MLALLATLALLSRGEKPPVQADSATVAIARGLRETNDAAIIAPHAQVVRRQGGVLWIGKGSSAYGFADQGDCEDHDCERYRLDAAFAAGFFGVSASYYEGATYYLTDGFHRVEVGEKPIPSPSGKRFFVGLLDEAGDGELNGISVWEFDRPSLGLARLRMIDVPVLAFAEFVAWHRDSCVEFKASRGYGMTSAEPQTFWLLEEAGDWVIHDRPPSGCR